MPKNNPKNPKEYPGFPGSKPSGYKPEYCQIAFDTLKEGKFLCDVAVALDQGKSTITYWKNQFPEFKQAIERGQAHSESIQIVNMLKDDGDVKTYNLLMRNQFGYDKDPKLSIKGWKKNKDKQVMYNTMIDIIADEGLTGKAMQSLVSVIVEGVKIDEHKEYGERIAKLEDVYNGKK